MAHEVQLKRRLAATPDEVYSAWTDAKSLSQWMFGLRGGRAETTADVRVGGKFHIDMFDGDGNVYPHDGEYLRLERPRLVELSWISRATDGQRSIVTVEMLPAGDGETDLTLTHRLLPSDESAGRHGQGWSIVFDNLADYVSKSEGAERLTR